MTVNRFEEYKLFVEDAARFTDRRQTANSLHIAANSAVLAAAAFLVKDAGLPPLWRVITVGLVLAAGVVVCLQWIGLINKYQKLVKLRIDQLRAMEETKEMAGCWQMYHKEDGLYPRDAKGELIPGKGLDMSKLEHQLPRIFIGVYGIFLAVCLVALIFAPSLMGLSPTS